MFDTGYGKTDFYLIIFNVVAGFVVRTEANFFQEYIEKAKEYCWPHPFDDNVVQINYRPLICIFLLDKNSYLKMPLISTNEDCECTSHCSSALSDPSKAECQPCGTTCNEIMQIKVYSGSNALKCNCVTGSDVVADSEMINSMDNTTNIASTINFSSDMIMSSNVTTEAPTSRNNNMECQCSLYCLPRTSKITVPPCVYTIGFLKRLKSPSNKITCECGIDRGEKLDTATLNPIFKCICSKTRQYYEL